jgi:hypothetical protein
LVQGLYGCLSSQMSTTAGHIVIGPRLQKPRSSVDLP